MFYIVLFFITVVGHCGLQGKVDALYDYTIYIDRFNLLS